MAWRVAFRPELTLINRPHPRSPPRSSCGLVLSHSSLKIRRDCEGAEPGRRSDRGHRGGAADYGGFPLIVEDDYEFAYRTVDCDGKVLDYGAAGPLILGIVRPPCVKDRSVSSVAHVGTVGFNIGSFLGRKIFTQDFSG